MTESTQSLFTLVLGTVLLCYILYAKLSEYRFRRGSIRVQGTIMEIFPHRHSTSYFLTYELDGVTRAAEYCGMPLIREFARGDVIEVLIDPRDPPDSEIPKSTHNAPGRAVGGGSCELSGASIFGLWDGIHIAASLSLIIYALR